MSFFNFVVDPDCPPDTVYFFGNRSLRLPIWTSEDGRVFYDVREIGDEHLRAIIDMLLRTGSKQYWCNTEDNLRLLFEDLDRRGLWTDAEELQSRLEGVVDRRQAA